MYQFVFEHAYFIGGIIFFLVWLPIFIRRKDLRREMLFAGALGSIFAATDVLWIPEYWNPPFFFNLINRVGFSIEDVFVGFFEGGIISVLYEYFIGKRLSRIPQRNHFRFGLIATFVVLYFGLEVVSPDMTLINWTAAAVIASLFGIGMRRELGGQVFAGGLLFMSLYFVLFEGFLLLFPSYVAMYYNHANLWSINILGIPLEGMLFAFSTGMLWSIVYEYTLGYRTVSFRNPS